MLSLFSSLVVRGKPVARLAKRAVSARLIAALAELPEELSVVFTIVFAAPPASVVVPLPSVVNGDSVVTALVKIAVRTGAWRVFRFGVPARGLALLYVKKSRRPVST